MSSGSDGTETPVTVGDVVQAVSARTGQEHPVTVTDIDGKCVRVRTRPGAGLAEGERVRIRHAIRGDARYSADTVVRGGGQRIELMRSTPWRRHQTRQSVRLHLAPPITCEVRVRASDEATKRKLPFEKARLVCPGRLLNISAGGVLVETQGPLATSEEVRLSFTLPNGHAVVAEGIVVRQAKSQPMSHRTAVRFVTLARGAEGHIVGYIYAAQVADRRTSLV